MQTFYMWKRTIECFAYLLNVNVKMGSSNVNASFVIQNAACVKENNHNC